jgi:serine/threonine protein kinase
MLKIARRTAWNGLLDREAYLLQLMEKEAADLEAEYSKVKGGDKMLNYQFFFPKLVESFVSTEQGGSRINIISLSHVADKISDLTPIGHLITKENVQIDPRTSAWILGKTLTALAFAKSMNVLIKDLSGDNILINRNQHYVTLLDWSGAIISNGEIPKDMIRETIANSAKETFLIMGGDLSTGKLPENLQLQGNSYEKYLKDMMDGCFSDVHEAHRGFYEIVLSAWPREFYKFTTTIN